jgi:hypothetical protein
MYVRVVRFTDVSAERMEELVRRVRESGGPPEGVRMDSLSVLFDEGNRTAVVLQRFANAADMGEGAEVFDRMDPGETPGTRVSVDMCEETLQMSG